MGPSPGDLGVNVSPRRPPNHMASQGLQGHPGPKPGWASSIKGTCGLAVTGSRCLGETQYGGCCLAWFLPVLTPMTLALGSEGGIPRPCR